MGSSPPCPATSLVLEVGGVGYRVYAGPGTLAGLTMGGRVKLHTHHLVREDQQALYGFRSAEELGFFELITTVSGVGPKVGLAIVSSRPVADLELAILQGDEAVLTGRPGRGQAPGGAHRPGAAREGGRGRGGRHQRRQRRVGGRRPPWRRWATRSREGREAARAAVAGLPAAASLEERVKEALRSLRRD